MAPLGLQKCQLPWPIPHLLSSAHSWHLSGAVPHSFSKPSLAFSQDHFLESKQRTPCDPAQQNHSHQRFWCHFLDNVVNSSCHFSVPGILNLSMFSACLPLCEVTSLYRTRKSAPTSPNPPQFSQVERNLLPFTEITILFFLSLCRPWLALFF